MDKVLSLVSRSICLIKGELDYGIVIQLSPFGGEQTMDWDEMARPWLESVPVPI